MDELPALEQPSGLEQQRGLGWLPDVPKPNDYSPTHEAVAPLLGKTAAAPHVAALKTAGARDIIAAPSALPAKVDLRPWFSPIEDQGQLGSCTANAAAGLLEYFERRTGGSYVDASRLFLYKAERDLLGWTGDTGAYLRTAMEALVLFGAVPERYWPYDGRPAGSNPRYDVEPPAFCYAFGSNYKAIKYFRLDPAGASTAQVLANIKVFLAAGFPSMFGFPVYSEYDHPLPGGLVAYPAPNSHYRGGHANVVAGYDDNLMIGADKGALLIRNSWGTSWANAGYGWMSYKYVTQGLADDWWSMVSANWVETGQFNP
jgi:C1A family cysteine protease